MAKDMNEQLEEAKKDHKDKRKQRREGEAAVLVVQDRWTCNKPGCDFLVRSRCMCGGSVVKLPIF